MLGMQCARLISATITLVTNNIDATEKSETIAVDTMIDPDTCVMTHNPRCGFTPDVRGMNALGRQNLDDHPHLPRDTGHRRQDQNHQHRR